MKVDRMALNKKKKRPSLFGDGIWKFQIYLRKYEYYLKCGGILKQYYKFKWHTLGVKLGITLEPNVCEEELCIAHYGLLTIKGGA